MGSLSPIHWLLVIVVLLLVFGPTRLAGAGKGLGEGIRAFKKGLSEDEIEDAKKAEEAKQIAEKPAEEKAPPKPADEKPA
ncbi:MAG TPA: twin-arginine translocase TatA/TatE family subunit [Polyangiaceae bacterium]|jgi:sec-independent protein translocase protein TatA|nr:twin-arginine translocase TatA/TatE family subunit [Polyangiaceae bacterium]